MKFFGGLIEIASTKIGKYPSDTSGNSIIATLTGQADKGETAQQYGQAGFISNPAKGTKGIRLRIGSFDVIIAALNYKVELPANPGESKVYSTDSDGVEKATHLLNADSEHIFNSGTDFAVAFEDLKLKIEELNTKFDAHIHPDPSSGFTGAPTIALNLDIDSSKVEKVRLP